MTCIRTGVRAPVSSPVGFGNIGYAESLPLPLYTQLFTLPARPACRTHSETALEAPLTRTCVRRITAERNTFTTNRTTVFRQLYSSRSASRAVTSFCLIHIVHQVTLKLPLSTGTGPGSFVVLYALTLTRRMLSRQDVCVDCADYVVTACRKSRTSRKLS